MQFNDQFSSFASDTNTFLREFATQHKTFQVVCCARRCHSCHTVTALGSGVYKSGKIIVGHTDGAKSIVKLNQTNSLLTEKDSCRQPPEIMPAGQNPTGWTAWNRICWNSWESCRLLVCLPPKCQYASTKESKATAVQT